MLDVLYDTTLVGRLWPEQRVLCFQYAPEWRNSSESFPLCPSLPMQEEPFASDAPALFFGNLLPEGPVLAAILKLKRLPEGDLYAQFKELGEDAAGAFSIVPAEVREKRTPSYRPYPQEELVRDIARIKENIPLLARQGELRLSLAGAQNKIPVLYADGQFSLPVQGAASTHILKPAITPEREFPDSVENEALCLRLAALTGLQAVEAEIAHIPGPLLIVRRYDRVANGATVLRLHQLDFCQLAGTLPDQKYEKDGGPSLDRIFQLIDRHSAQKARDRLAALDWVVFNYLIGNADAHAKNLALLQHGRTGLRLAPFYDLLCTAAYPSLDDTMAMSIGGEFRPEWVRERNWREFALTVGLNMTLFKKRALALGERLQQVLPAACASEGIEPGRPIAAKLGRTIQDRARKLAVNM